MMLYSDCIESRRNLKIQDYDLVGELTAENRV